MEILDYLFRQAHVDHWMCLDHQGFVHIPMSHAFMELHQSLCHLFFGPFIWSVNARNCSYFEGLDLLRSMHVMVVACEWWMH